MNSRGLSSIVGNVMMIFLVVSSVFLLSAIVMKLVYSPSLSPQISCSTYKIQSPLKILSACYSNDTKEIVLSILHIENNNLNSMQITSSIGGIAKEWSCSGDCGNCKLPGTGEVKNYYLRSELPANGASLSIGIDNCEVDSKIIGNC